MNGDDPLALVISANVKRAEDADAKRGSARRWAGSSWLTRELPAEVRVGRAQFRAVSQWLLGYDGSDGLEAADAAYYASADRAALDPDPARHIAEARQLTVRAVDFT